jgi:hypothetical protein
MQNAPLQNGLILSPSLRLKCAQKTQSPVTVLADSGVENVNGVVDNFLFGGILKRVLAQVEIVESNSRSCLIAHWTIEPPTRFTSEGQRMYRASLKLLDARHAKRASLATEH